ncbi:MAG TPA: CotH kinase family protein, partial [Opitutaceae bacterium]|nr:CotH kinase family protein [Opitutaceae bacterium]
SSTWPKQSDDIDLSDTLAQDLDEPLFGMDSDKNWDAVSPWHYDRTFIHNAFVYSLARQMGHWAPRTTPAEMFIHSAGGPLDAASYAGITVMTDRIKVGANRVNIYSLSPSDTTAPNVTGGYILRIDHPQDAAGLYTWTTAGGQALMLDTPKADVLVQPQIAYITNYVQQMENAMMGDAASNYATHNYLNFLDRASWVDYHLINIFVENVDAFQYSVYFTKDVNGLIEAGPVWDYDESLDGDTESVEDPKNWTPGDAGNVFWNIGWWQYLTHDPDFMQVWIDRWQSLRLTTLSTGNLTQLVDTLAAQVGPAAAARDAALWPDDASRFPGGWQGEIDNLKSWLATRAQWIDSQFVAPPLVDASTTRVVLVPATGVPLAYTTDGSDPRLSGGAVSASATVTASPVILPGGTSFCARSYQSSMQGVFPGSPWSSPVTTATNSGSVLANLSALGTIGTANPALYVGFTVAGSGTKPLLLRGDGPTLARFNVATALPDPQLTLYDHGGSIVATNTGWSAPSAPGPSALAGDVAAATAANFSAVGAFALPANSADCAFVATLPPGVYSAEVAAAGTGSGTALAELYDMAASAPQVHLANISERAAVGPGGQGVSAGFVISGSAPKTVLIRGVGPALAGFGVAGALAQPQLSLYDSSSILIATNAGWGAASTPGASTVPATLQAATAALFSSVSAFSLPANSADCAMIAELPPGTYTAQVTGLNGATGAALIEIYDLAQ